MIEKYNFTEIEKKWQKKWEEEKPFKVTEDRSREKYYVPVSYTHLTLPTN